MNVLSNLHRERASIEVDSELPMIGDRVGKSVRITMFLDVNTDVVVSPVFRTLRNIENRLKEMKNEIVERY